MRTLIITLAIAVASPAAAQKPRVFAPDECITLSRIALVSGSAALRGVERARMDAMLIDMFNMPDALSRRVAEEVIARAYADPPGTPGLFAEDVAARCFAAGGVPARIFGARL